MRNIYPYLIMKMLSGNEKIYVFFSTFQLSLSGQSFIQVTFCCRQRTAKVYLFCLLWKETWIYFDQDIV